MFTEEQKNKKGNPSISGTVLDQSDPHAATRAASTRRRAVGDFPAI